MSDTVRDQIPIRRALVSVYDKTGLEELVRGLHDAGVELVSTGGSAALIDDARPARSPRSRTSPASPSASTAGSRRCTRACTPASSPTAASSPTSQQLAELGVEPFDLVVSNLYPFTADRRLRRDARRVRRADRHRRPVDGARRGQEPPVGRDRHLARRGTPTCSPRSPAGGFTLAAAPARWPPRRSCTPRRTTCTWRRWMGNVLTDTSDGTGFPAWVGRDVGQGGRAALRREPAPAGRALRQRLRAGGPGRRPSSCTARRCPTTTTSTPTRPGGRRTTSTSPAVAIIKHANPCGIAVGADVAEAHRKAHECDPVSAFGGVIADQRAGHRSRWPSRSPRSSPRWSWRPAYDDGAVEILPGARRTSGSCVVRADAQRGGVEIRPICGGLLMQQRRVDAGRRRAATTRRRWTLATGEAASDEVLADLAFAWRACRAVKSNAILLATRRRLGRRRHGPGQPGRLLPARGRRGRGSGPRGSVAASDAFFPFADGPQILHRRRRRARSCSRAGRCATS